MLQASELPLDGGTRPVELAPAGRLAKDQRPEAVRLDPPAGRGAHAGGAAPLLSKLLLHERLRHRPRGGRQLATPARAGPVTTVFLERGQVDASSAGVEVGGVLDWPRHSVSVLDFGDLGPKDLFAAFIHADPVS